MNEEMEPKDTQEIKTETEENRRPVRDYYADGTPVSRSEETREAPRPQEPDRPSYESYRFGESGRPSYGYEERPQGRKSGNGKRAAAIVAVLVAFSLFAGLMIAGISHLGDYIRTRIVVDEPTQTASAPETVQEKEPVRLAPAQQSTAASSIVASRVPAGRVRPAVRPAPAARPTPVARAPVSPARFIALTSGPPSA